MSGSPLFIQFHNMCLFVTNGFWIQAWFSANADHEPYLIIDALQVPDEAARSLGTRRLHGWDLVLPPYAADAQPAEMQAIPLAGCTVSFVDADGRELDGANSRFAAGANALLPDLSDFAAVRPIELRAILDRRSELASCTVSLPSGFMRPIAMTTIGGRKAWAVGPATRFFCQDAVHTATVPDGAVLRIEKPPVTTTIPLSAIQSLQFASYHVGPPVPCHAELVNGVVFLEEFGDFDVFIPGTQLPIPYAYWPDYCLNADSTVKTDPYGGPCMIAMMSV